MKNDLLDPGLFGNEAGEDEEVDVLNSYFVDKPEFDRFYSSKERVFFVRSKKGVGKSALLKRAMSKREAANSHDLVIYVKGSDLVALQDIKGDSPSDLIYGWQQRICSRVNFEIGAQMKVAFTDEAMTLVEGSELAGFRGRNLVGSLLDRLKLKISGVEVGRDKLHAGHAEALLSRFSGRSDTNVWLFVDDIDATFINTDHERLKISTFFSACRNIANNVKGVNVRVSIRTDVWSIIRQHDESLDKCEQYMLDLKWSTDETGDILERKVLSYFQRRYPQDKRYQSLRVHQDREAILALVFAPRFHWNNRRLEPFRPIHILSAGRPRWAAQLCKLGAKNAVALKRDVIALSQLLNNMRDYGGARIDDLYREHRHQCPSLQYIIESFAGGSTRYSTGQLMERITRQIIKKIGIPDIDGTQQSRGSLSVANFLYRIGFICARDDLEVAGLGFVRYEDRPNLLSSMANLDDNLEWEIHPSYRKVLRIG